MPNPSRPLSDTELEVLKALWDHGPGTVREINDHLRKRKKRWAYTTLQTLLGRLVEKGYVDRDESGFAHVFSSGVSRDELLEFRLKALAQEICGGAKTPLLVNLVQGHRFERDEIDSFRKLLDEADTRLTKEKKPAQKRGQKRSRKRPEGTS